MGRAENDQAQWCDLPEIPAKIQTNMQNGNSYPLHYESGTRVEIGINNHYWV